MYDYLIVGAGLFGATFAHEITAAGKSCCIFEKRDVVGGNCYTEKVNDIDVHVYGAHIFKTDNAETWSFINQFAEFMNFVNTPIAICENKAYNLPINMNTFSQVFGVSRPEEAMTIIMKETAGLPEPKNLEELAISKVGKTLYRMFIKGYTEKQWGKPCSQLPMTILSDIPVRFTYNNNYYDKRYQGVPIGGYTQIIRKMLKGSDVHTGHRCDKKTIDKKCSSNKVIYTGPIDEFFGYCFGRLEYRSLRFKTEVINSTNVNGVAVMNFTDKHVPYTRVIEHKHFCGQKSNVSILTYEFPAEYTGNDDAYYPVDDHSNRQLYLRYLDYAKEKYGDKLIFGGRLGMYRYDDMAECIENARRLARKELLV